MKILLNGILALFFGGLSFGAFADGRRQAIPLALILAGFAIYSAARLVKLLR
jgi:hypothetical protein